MLEDLSAVCATLALITALAGSAVAQQGPSDSSSNGDPTLMAGHLRCEAKVDPLGIDVPQPRLSWLLSAIDPASRGLRQTALQVHVATSEGALLDDAPDLWDSGKVASDQTSQLAYGGVPLTTGMNCSWRVRVWDNDDRPSSWSEPARWSMGLLQPGDWSSKWIAYTYKADTDPKLPQATFWREEITLDKEVARATVYATALGSYVLRINGQRVGADCFNPGWPEFRKRVFYHTYDVTSMLRSGPNALGAILSTGWYAGYIWAGPFNYGTTPKLLVQISVEYTDGSSQTFGTGAGWKVSYGPLIEADIQQGETYDARRELAGWDAVGYDESAWSDPDVVMDAVPAHIEKSAPSIDLCAAPHPPVRVQREITPVAMTSPAPGVYVYDLGDTVAGWARLRVKGPAGAALTLRYSGMLNPDGSIYTDYLREARVRDTYILKGSAVPEVWEPLFTYHGFRYIEVTGYPGVPTLDAVRGIVCNADVARTGEFACSDQRVNRLYRNCADTMAANLVDLVTGCSDRAERLGWMGSGQMFYAMCYTFDVEAFLTKWMTDIVDAQSLGKSGSFLQVSPIWGDIESPGWSDDGVCLPYALHRFYGNVRLIEERYEALTTYIDHLERSLTDYLRIGPVFHSDGEPFIGYGDWLAIVEDREKHADILNTLWNGWSVSNMAEMAAAIGKADDAAEYRELLAKMKAAFDKAYVSSDGAVRDNTQGEYALGLYFGFFAEAKTAGAVEHLVDDILNKSHTQMRPDALGANPEIGPGHLTTGFHSSRALLPVLSTHGRNDVAYQLLLRDDYPSWLYPVRVGATSNWERWDSWMPEKGFQDPRMNSFGMPHLQASVVEWLVGYAGGVQPDLPGFRRIRIRPYLGDGLEWLETSHDSPSGRISVRWSQSEDRCVTMQVTVPPNTSALVCVPKNGADAMDVNEGGAVVWRDSAFAGGVAGITNATDETDYVVFETGSGSYDFRTTPQTRR